MCGILFAAGPDAAPFTTRAIERLAHRGPDERHVWSGDMRALGFARLAITDASDAGRQPVAHARWVGACNGEFYNHRALRQTHDLDASPCDTHVLLPLFERLGLAVVDALDGCYAAVIYDATADELICLRDHIGQKPLFIASGPAGVCVTSELKAIAELDTDDFAPVPLGATRYRADDLQVLEHRAHRLPVADDRPLTELLVEAVHKRLPDEGQPVGVFLSGGLDSSLVTAIAAAHRRDLVAYTLASPQSPDAEHAARVAGSLGVRLRSVVLPSQDALPELVSRVVYATESYNPSIVSNGLAAFLLAREASRDGLEVVLTGEGADEFFGGYHHFLSDDPWRETRQQLVDDLHTTEARRLDMATMAHGVEARCPFFDRAVRAFADRCEHHHLYDEANNKAVLRTAASDWLDATTRMRAKTSFDVGSGIRGRVVEHCRRGGRTERDALREVWRRHFAFEPAHPYFHAYRTFDAAIDRRGATHR